jgi:pyruvate kinase
MILVLGDSGNRFMNRRTRIVATLGPATDPPEVLRAVLEAGVDVARINFSHGSAEEHLSRIAALRAAAEGLGKPVAVLADLPGPKLRVYLAAPRQLEIGQTVTFSKKDTPIEADDLCITEPEMLNDVLPGHRILLDDGRLQMTAGKQEGDRLYATVKVGGQLLPKKGVNLPDTPLTIPALTDLDRVAIAVAAKGQVDWLALSFVRTAEAADELRAEGAKHGFTGPVLAKIERPEALDRAEAIIEAFDGIMVARGDLGVEIPLERVPTSQKRLITLARLAGKPVITATDMLDSMRNNPRPTRAEASDVANAIYDGTDAVMLSGETAIGKYPVESVSCMASIAMEAENHLGEGPIRRNLHYYGEMSSVDDMITQAVVELASKLEVDAIITPTLSGRTARLIARHRPKTSIVAPAPTEEILRQMCIVWGLKAARMDFCRRSGDDRMSGAVQAAFASNAVKEGDRVLVLAGHPVEGGEHLPTIRLAKVGKDGMPCEP